MHPEILSITLFGIVAAFTPGPNNFVAFYSGFNFGIVRTLPHIIGVTFGFPFLEGNSRSDNFSSITLLIIYGSSTL